VTSDQISSLGKPRGGELINSFKRVSPLLFFILHDISADLLVDDLAGVDLLVDDLAGVDLTADVEEAQAVDDGYDDDDEFGAIIRLVRLLLLLLRS
jgi:hypothetical protein